VFWCFGVLVVWCFWCFGVLVFWCFGVLVVVVKRVKRVKLFIVLLYNSSNSNKEKE